MTNTTRKRFWPLSLAATLAVIGVLAVAVALTALPSATFAQDPPPPPALPGATPTPTRDPNAPPPPPPVPGQTPTATATPDPTAAPTPTPTTAPTAEPTATPAPTARPTATPAPTPDPTAEPTPEPTVDPQNPPVVVSQIGRVDVIEGGHTRTIDVADNFADPDEDDTLTYTAWPDNGGIATVDVDGSMVTVTAGRTPGSTTIVVTATDPSGGQASQRFTVRVQNPRPTAPRNVRLYPLDHSMTIRWDTPASHGEPSDAVITGYWIRRTVADDSPLKGNGGDALIGVDAATFVYRDQALSYNEFYTYTVYAVNNYSAKRAPAGYRYGPGPDSTPPQTRRTAESGGRIEPETRAPSPPQNVMLAPTCDDSIMVSWEEPSDPGQVRGQGPGKYVGPDWEGGQNAGMEIQGTDAVVQSYTVERRVGVNDEENANPWEVLAEGITDLFYVDPGDEDDDTDLSYGNTYNYRVTARNNVPLNSEPSAVKWLHLLRPDSPDRPRSLVVVSVNPPVAELQWDPPEEGGTWRTESDIDPDTNQSKNLSYRIERKLDDGAWMLVVRRLPHQYSDDGLGTVKTQEYTDLQAPPQGQIAYRVAAQLNLCIEARSAWNEADEVEANIFAQPLGAPSGLTATAGATAGTADLTWTPGANSEKHWIAGVKQSDRAAGDYSSFIWVRATSTAMHTVPGLESGTEYVFTVAAGRGEGDEERWSPWSPLASVTPN